jgi:hypothetical protein
MLRKAKGADHVHYKDEHPYHIYNLHLPYGGYFDLGQFHMRKLISFSL